jgi:hypothetical protein
MHANETRERCPLCGEAAAVQPKLLLIDESWVAAPGKDPRLAYRNLYSALRRRPNETVAALMQRLDDAIGLARHKGVRTNEIDDGRYILKQPSTRKRR